MSYTRQFVQKQLKVQQRRKVLLTTICEYCHNNNIVKSS